MIPQPLNDTAVRGGPQTRGCHCRTSWTSNKGVSLPYILDLKQGGVTAVHPGPQTRGCHCRTSWTSNKGVSLPYILDLKQGGVTAVHPGPQTRGCHCRTSWTSNKGESETIMILSVLWLIFFLFHDYLSICATHSIDSVLLYCVVTG